MPKTALEYWLALKLVSRLAVHKKLLLVETFSLKGLFLLSPTQLKQAGLSTKQIEQIIQPDWHFITSIKAQTEKVGGKIICYDDHNYPQQLKQIYDPPLVLFVLGQLALLNQMQIAIVGSRAATHTALAFAKQLASQLTQQNIIVTSGLALGIDGAAHQGAFIDNQAKTIAVIATGLDKIYPSRHRSLADKIVKYQGLILSEFLPGTLAKAGHFPRRNRLISGLSLGVVVIEAEIKSGSLITARCALEQNREVFAVPGSINNPMSKGCHWLIKQGAKLIEDHVDIIEELDLLTVQTYINDQQKDVKNNRQDLFIDSLLASVDYETTSIDTLVARSDLTTAEVLIELTTLELKGLVTAVPGGYIRSK